MHRAVLVSVFGASVLAVALLAGETPASAGGVMNLTATTANVGGAPDAVRIEVLRWSTDEDRDRLMAAWNLKLPAPDTGGGRAGGGRGKAAGRGGRGPGRGAPAAEPAPLTPEGALARALQESTTVGYLWSSEIAGYALRFAAKEANPDGSQRIVLITDRRLGATNKLWNPTFGSTPNTYEFSVIELRLNAKGEGEGKVSLTGKVAPDPGLHIVAIENYDALPVVFAKVRKQTVRQ
jgi:hypothetical protein